MTGNSAVRNRSSKSPCYNLKTRQDCPKRHAGCAATCPEWAEYVKQRNARYEEVRQLRKNADVYSDVRKTRADLYDLHRLRYPKKNYLGGKDHE